MGPSWECLESLDELSQTSPMETGLSGVEILVWAQEIVKSVEVFGAGFAFEVVGEGFIGKAGEADRFPGEGAGSFLFVLAGFLGGVVAVGIDVRDGLDVGAVFLLFDRQGDFPVGGLAGVGGIGDAVGGPGEFAVGVGRFRDRDFLADVEVFAECVGLIGEGGAGEEEDRDCSERGEEFSMACRLTLLGYLRKRVRQKAADLPPNPSPAVPREGKKEF